MVDGKVKREVEKEELASWAWLWRKHPLTFLSTF